MADTLTDLRTTIARRLKQFWPSSDHASPNSLREEVAAEIALKLQQDPDRKGGLDSTGEETGPLDKAADAALALGARLKPRGIFEDDWSARPSAQRPWPVILVHGTCDTKGIWQLMGEDLRAEGWAVFAPDYGNRATNVLSTSAKQLGAYIETVLAATGAEQVILVGHSQGGLLSRYWMRQAGTADKVKHLVCIGSPNHGTSQGGIVSPLLATKRSANVMASIVQTFFGPAGADQIIGSPLLTELIEGGDLEDGVNYTCIATKQDTVVVPPESCFLNTEQVEDGTVRNVYVQDFDRGAIVLHHDLPVDRRVRVIVSTILDQIL